jgi:cysteine desulfurase
MLQMRNVVCGLPAHSRIGHRPLPPRHYLDHAATTPLRAEAQAALLEGFAHWANPSSPHGDGRRARALLEDARTRIGAALGWGGAVILTSGATEAIALATASADPAKRRALATEHDAVLRHVSPDHRLPVDAQGQALTLNTIAPGDLVAIQQVNSETGVIQPVDALADTVHEAGGLLLCDASQSAGKIPLPSHADMIVVSAHKLGGPVGIGALLVRDLAMLRPSGGQEQGYRAGTEAMPLALAFAAALEAPKDWLSRIAQMRERLESELANAGVLAVAAGAPRLPTIGSYHLPGVEARAALIRLDLAGIAASAGSACSSGTLRPSHVLSAMGRSEVEAGRIIRLSLGHSSQEADVDAVLSWWHAMQQGPGNR